MSNALVHPHDLGGTHVQKTTDADVLVTRFTQQDGVDEEWRIMQPLLDNPPPVHTYQPGTWGPAAADQLVAGYGGWREPWMAES